MTRTTAVSFALCATLLLGRAAAAAPVSLTLDDVLARARVDAAAVQLAAPDRERAAGEGVAARAPRYDPTVSLAVGPWFGDRTQVALDASVMQTFELGGKRVRRMAVADAAQRVATAATQRAVQLAVVEARRAFELALLARARRDVAVENEHLAQELQVAAAERFRLGATIQLDVELAAATAGRAVRDRLDAERVYAAARRAIAAAIGAPPDVEVEPVGELMALHDVEAAGPSVTQAMAQRADLQASVADEHRARAAVELAAVELGTDLALGLAYNRTPSDQTLLVAASITLPLRDRARGTKAIARAELSRTRVTAVVLRREIEREVLSALASEGAARAAVAAFDEQVLSRLAAMVEGATTMYRSGQIDLTQVSLARRELVETRLARLDALATWIEAHAALELAMGEARDR